MMYYINLFLTILHLKPAATSCQYVVLFMLISFSTGCRNMISEKPEASEDSLILIQEQQYLGAKLENNQRILFLRIDEHFEVEDTMFSYLLHEELGPLKKGSLKIDTTKRMCYFFDPVYDEYAERYLSNNLISFNLDIGAITQIYDFRDFNIGEWEFDFKRNSLFFIDYARNILYKFNLDTKTHEAIWHFADEAPLWHLDMEFNQESIILFYKNDFNTRQTIISQKDNKILSNRIVWTTAHPQSNTEFKRNNDEFIEITRTELGADRMTLFLYNTNGEVISKELPYRPGKQYTVEWLNKHIVVRHDQQLSIFDRDLNLVSFHETGKLHPTVFVTNELGNIYRALPPSKKCFLLKPDLTLTELHGDLFYHLLFMIQDKEIYEAIK
jgi:hypothetical protein